MNLMKPGGFMEIYFDDLQYVGRQQDFSQDPQWHESGDDPLIIKAYGKTTSDRRADLG